MGDNTLNDYISKTYNQWVDYASYYVKRSKLPINPSEVVNDVLCTLLERDVDRLEQMMNRCVNKKTELDLFVMRIIKVSIYSPRSPFRYQRGQHCTSRLRDNMCDIYIPESTGLDVENIYTDIRLMLREIDAPDIAKKIFVWKFFDGNDIAKWPGDENRRMLYTSYRRIFNKIFCGIRCKIGG